MPPRLSLVQIRDIDIALLRKKSLGDISREFCISITQLDALLAFFSFFSSNLVYISTFNPLHPLLPLCNSFGHDSGVQPYLCLDTSSAHFSTSSFTTASGSCSAAYDSSVRS
jgi:hypothetical protein